MNDDFGKNICKYNNKIKNRIIISKIYHIFDMKKYDNIFLEKKIFSLCGRVFRKRIMGKSSFIEIKDFSGSIQLYLSYNNLSANYDNFISFLKLGDIIFAKGKLFLTKTLEISINVLSIELLSKNFNTFPDKLYGVVDKEICYRNRYLDLMINDVSKNKFIMRSNILYFIRQFFVKKGFLEVETPIMQNIIGGADAKPFETYHNYLNSKLFLRVSPELYLKRLIVGGFEKVFEIGKSFRNEGISIKHNPEFTMIEFYQAYANYLDLISITQKLFCFLSMSIFGKYSIEYNGTIIDFSNRFNFIEFFASISKYANISLDDLFNKEYLINFCSIKHIDFDVNFSLCDFHAKLFDIFVENNLIQPTFIIHYPVDLSPLARRKDDDVNLVERFELYICCKEIANGFSELNDPHDQSNRFLDQIRFKSDYKLRYDDDYINALKYGMPPTAGEGIGIDRLVMLFTNSSSIKDILFFPLMKDKHIYD